MIKRVPTGIAGLDHLIGGGVPRGSLILLAGKPGTGKTIFGSRFLCEGATQYDENGIYVSFLEGRKTLIANLSEFCDHDHEKLDKEGKFRILDLVTTKEGGISASLESIIDEIHTLKAKRLVIDSFSAMAQSFKEPIEARIVLQTILSNMVRQLGCTTLLIVENPTGKKGMGLGMEEFVADGVIVLKRGMLDGRVIRELEITKLRGTRIDSPRHPFTLEGGFTVFEPFSHKPIDQMGRLKYVPNSDDYFSCGNRALDKILGGGAPKGTLMLLEVGKAVPLTAYGVLTYPIVANFLNNKAPVVGIQSLGADPARTYERWKVVAGENAVYARSIEKLRAGAKQERDYLVLLKGERPEEKTTEYLQVGAKLREQTGKPVLWWIALDHFVDIFDAEHAEEVLSELSVNVIRNREMAGILAKPGLQEITRTASNIASVHIRVFERHGSVLLYGVKPRTPIYALTADNGKGLSSTAFTPIV
jgi:KaiC/GvpD/RAD55 family RecA-like ATPase